jgi:hypothetical protein
VKLFENSKICTLHFRKEDIIGSKMKYVRPNSNPVFDYVECDKDSPGENRFIFYQNVSPFNDEDNEDDDGMYKPIR